MTLLPGLLLLALAAWPPGHAGAEGIELSVRTVEGELVATLRATHADAHFLLGELARQGGRRLAGADELALEPLSVELVDRPYELVVRRVAQALGCSARLGRDLLEIRPEPGSDEPASALEEQAELAWLSALRAWPTHALGAQAELELARLQERRGNLAAARTHLATLVERHPRSERVPEALWRAAGLLQRSGRWDEAWAELSTLSSLDRPHDYHVRARLELARTSVALGDPRQALYVLEALEQDWPATSATELAARYRVRAEVELARGESLAALRCIDQAERLGGGPDPASLAVRGRALELGGRFDEASRCWLRVASESPAAGRAAALVQAARLALACGDELAVLFMQRLAEQQGLAETLLPYASTARERLGLFGAHESSRSTSEEISLAEEALARGDLQAAFAATHGPWVVREGLPDAERLRLVLARARAQAAGGRPEDALATLRLALPLLDAPDARRALYLFAGELHEALGRFDLAAEAYRGRL